MCLCVQMWCQSVVGLETNGKSQCTDKLDKEERTVPGQRDTNRFDRKIKIYFQSIWHQLFFSLRQLWITCGLQCWCKCNNNSACTSNQSLHTWKLCFGKTVLLFSDLSPCQLWVTWVLSFPFQHHQHKQWQTLRLLRADWFSLIVALIMCLFLLKEIMTGCLSRQRQELIRCCMACHAETESSEVTSRQHWSCFLSSDRNKCFLLLSIITMWC